MARPAKKYETVTRRSPEPFTNMNEVETRLASVSIPNEKKGGVRDQIMKTRVQMYRAYRNNYSKAQIAAAFKTSKQTVSQYINAVEMALKTADLVKNQNL